MTPPANRIGAIRGPNGSTLDDIVAALEGLTGVLQDQAITLESMRNFLSSIATDTNLVLQRLTFLTGSTAPANGFTSLPVYLTSVLGRRTFLTELDYPANAGLQGLLWDYINRAVDINLMLEGLPPNFPSAGGAPVLPLLLAQLQQLNGVTGDIEGDPIGSTIKDLLRSIDVNQARAADCCEEGQNGGGGDPPPQNTVPLAEGSCAEGRQGPHQATGYYRLNEGVSGAQLWGLKFDGLGDVSTFVPVNSVTHGAAFPMYESATDKQICLRWNTTGNPVPGQGGYAISGDTPPSMTGTNQVFAVPASDDGSFFDAELQAGVAFGFRIQVDDEADLPLATNFWLYWSEAPS